MKATRREFLHRSTLAAASMYLGARTARSEMFPDQQESTPHHLLFDDTDIPRILETVRHPRFAGHWKSMKEADLASDTRFLKEEIRFNNHVKDMARARLILERSAFVYRLTHDKGHLDVSLLAVDALLRYRRWDYFLEGGEHTIALQRASEATIAMSCAREWLDDALNDGMKREMEKQIAEKGAPACFRTLYGMMHPDRVRGWGFDPEDDYQYRFDLSRWPIILNSTNLKVIPIAGLGIAGCLLYNKHPQAPRWVTMAVQSARAFSTMFGADGSYEEGVGYWGYTALHLIILVEALRRKLGIDQRNLINFPGTVRYALRMSMPTIGHTDDCVNFSDARYMGDVSTAAWTAHALGDRISQYVALSIGEIRSHYSMIWYDPSVQPETPGPDLHDVRFDNDWVVARTGWEAMSSVVAMRSGGPANHEHADRNSIIFKAFGERLFHDPFHAAYSYTEPDWLLRKTEAHTAVLINGKGHQYHDGHEGTNSSWAEARIEQYRDEEQHMVVTSDATEAYRLVDPNVDAVFRTMVFLKPDVLLVLDRVRMKVTPATVQLRFQVCNFDGKGTAAVDRKSFSMMRPNASLEAKVTGIGAFSIHADKLRLPEEKGVHPYVEVASENAADHMILTVCTAQAASHPHGKFDVKRKGTEWVVEGAHNGRHQRISMETRENIPTVVIG